MRTIKKTQFIGLVLLGFLGTCLLGTTLAAPPVEARSVTYSLDIPAQSLGDALQALALASEHRLLCDSDLVEGKSSAALKGQFTAEEAVKQLLSGTDLSYEVTSDGLVMIKSAVTSPSTLSTVGGSFRFTQSSSPSNGESARKADEGNADSTGSFGSSTTKEGEASKVEEIIVTGTNIRGQHEIAAPRRSYTRTDIENAGSASLEDLFDQMPQNFSAVTARGQYAVGNSDVAAVNREQAVAVDLYGLGAPSTLTILNGTRRAPSIGGRAVDISAIPLSIVERLDIVTGGSSAIYGSDAVAGVVNVITRRDYKGAETRLTLGTPFKGSDGDSVQISQTSGFSSGRAGMIAAYDYQHTSALDYSTLGLLSKGFVPFYSRLNAQPRSNRHSLFVSGRISAATNIELTGDILIGSRSSKDLYRWAFEGSDHLSGGDTDNSNDQLSFSPSAHIAMNKDWSLDLRGSLSSAENRYISKDTLVFPNSDPLRFVTSFHDESNLDSFTAVTNGLLGSFVGMHVSLAAGATWQQEQFKTLLKSEGVAYDNVRRARKVRSLFAELKAPLSELWEDVTHTLDLSIAGRFDDYSDFGCTSNPQVGLLWKAGTNIAFRGTYAAAFRAPALVELDGSTSYALQNVPDPSRAGASTPALFWLGANPQLRPEQADTWTVGADWTPATWPRARLSVSLFNVRYRGRVDSPFFSLDRALVLTQESSYASVIDRLPGAAELARIVNQASDFDNDTGLLFDPSTQTVQEVFPDVVLVDARTNNIAVETMRALNTDIRSSFETKLGTLSAGASGTYVLRHDRSVTRSSPAIDAINQVGKPVGFKLRVEVGIEGNRFSAFVHLNHTDGYDDQFVSPTSRIRAHDTLDLVTRFNGDGVSGETAGLDTVLTVRNIFNAKPPLFLNSPLGIRFDGTNASPLGRNVALQMTKSW